MVAKNVTSMFLAAMPEIDFADSDLLKKAEMPSSNPNSAITVEAYAPVPFNL